MEEAIEGVNPNQLPSIKEVVNAVLGTSEGVVNEARKIHPSGLRRLGRLNSLVLASAFLSLLWTTACGSQIVSPDIQAFNRRLEATATAVVEKGGSDTFQPEGPFRREDFEQIAAGTYRMTLDRPESKLNATVWLAEVRQRDDGNFDYYFVTAADWIQELGEGSSVKAITVSQPDKSKFFPASSVRAIVDSVSGQAVVELRFEGKAAPPPKPLPRNDDSTFPPNTPFLMVGYPGAFTVGGHPIIEGTVGKTGDFLWYLQRRGLFVSALSSKGASGSPVAVIGANGELFIGGIVVAGAEEKSETPGSKPLLLISPLINIEKGIKNLQE